MLTLMLETVSIMKIKSIIILTLVFAGGFSAFSQTDLSDLFKDELETDEVVEYTFKTTRLIHTHTTKTVDKNELDFRITHRFDDIAGSTGGIETLFGFDNVSDIRIAFEYGVTDDITAGFGRSKGGYGGGPKQVLDGFVKYKFLKQTKKSMPLTVTALVLTELATEKKGANVEALNSYPKFSHRFAYMAQVLIAHKRSGTLSFMLMPTYIHRNFVNFGDENNNFAMGAGGRVKLTKRMAIIVDYYHFFSKYRSDLKADKQSDVDYFNPLGIGLEIETGGHVFHLNFSNSAGIIETQYIPYTTKNWLDGGFRFGFNISRVFGLGDGGGH